MAKYKGQGNAVWFDDDSLGPQAWQGLQLLRAISGKTVQEIIIRMVMPRLDNIGERAARLYLDLQAEAGLYDGVELPLGDE